MSIVIIAASRATAASAPGKSVDPRPAAEKHSMNRRRLIERCRSSMLFHRHPRLELVEPLEHDLDLRDRDLRDRTPRSRAARASPPDTHGDALARIRKNLAL